jgi:hypothetical protein
MRNRALHALAGGATNAEAAQAAGVSLATLKRIKAAQNASAGPFGFAPLPPHSASRRSAPAEEPRDWNTLGELVADLVRAPDVVLAIIAVDVAKKNRGAAMVALSRQRP